MTINNTSNLVNRKEDKTRTSIYCPEDLYEKVKTLAEKADISVNSALVQLIQLGIESVENNK